MPHPHHANAEGAGRRAHAVWGVGEGWGLDGGAWGGAWARWAGGRLRGRWVRRSRSRVRVRRGRVRQVVMRLDCFVSEYL